MWKKIKALQEQRAQKVAALKASLNKAETEKRDLTKEETAAFDTLKAEIAQLDEQRSRLEAVYALEQAAGDPAVNPGRGDTDPEIRSALDMPEKDLNRYSIQRAIQLRMDGKPLDGVEAEVNKEFATRMHKPADGFYVPLSLPNPLATRATTSTTGAGAVLKEITPTIIETLRGKTHLVSLGATVLTGLSMKFAMPKQSAAAAAEWKAEGSAFTGSSIEAANQVVFDPNRLGTYDDYAKSFLMQTSVDVEGFIRNDIARAIAAALDTAAINGSGTGVEPEGILQNSAATTVAIGTDGGAMTWALAVALETAVANANADMGSLAYLMSTKARGKLKVTERATNTAKFIWHDDNTINGYRAEATSLVPSNLTKGSGTALSAVIFGDWSAVIAALFGAADIVVDPYSQASSGLVRITITQHADVNLRRGESFAKIVDFVTT